MNATTSLIPLVEANPAMVLTDPETFSRFYDEMKRETDAHVPDLTTLKGRKAIAALAYKVARTKTAIDEAGKLLNEEARAKINLVDASRRTIRDQLDALKDQVRKPLDDWEAAEESRIALCQGLFDTLNAYAVVNADESAAAIGERIDYVAGFDLNEIDFQDMHEAVLALQAKTLAALREGMARTEKAEADQIELDRLRAEAAERAAKEEADKAAAAEKARQVQEAQVRAEEAKRAAEAAAAAEAKRIADAEAKAKADAELAAEQALQVVERAHQEELAAAKRRADEAEAARKADAEAIEQAKHAEEVQHLREAAEQARRERSRTHRANIMGAAKLALIGLGIAEDHAIAAVKAIALGQVPNVSMEF